MQFRVSHLSVLDDRNGVLTDANANYFKMREEGNILVGATLKTILLLHDTLMCYLGNKTMFRTLKQEQRR